MRMMRLCDCCNTNSNSDRRRDELLQLQASNLFPACLLAHEKLDQTTMDIHSFEQRSSSELGHEIEWKRNRVVLANRREPNVAWSTANQPIRRGGGGSGDDRDSSLLGWLFRCGKYWPSASAANRANRLKSTSSLLSISIQHIDAGPFPSNEWRTSKYTLMNFLPKNLFEQFRRFSIFYYSLRLRWRLGRLGTFHCSQRLRRRLGRFGTFHCSKRLRRRLG